MDSSQLDRHRQVIETTSLFLHGVVSEMFLRKNEIPFHYRTPHTGPRILLLRFRAESVRDISNVSK